MISKNKFVKIINTLKDYSKRQENLNKAITQNEANFIQRGFNSNTASKNKLKQIGVIHNNG